MRALKDDQVVPSDPPSLMSDYIAELIRRDLTKLPFARIFEKNPLLIPTPNSSLIKTGTIWVPQRLANAIVRKGLGRIVETCVERATALSSRPVSILMLHPFFQLFIGSIQYQSVFLGVAEDFLWTQRVKPHRLTRPS